MEGGKKISESPRLLERWEWLKTWICIWALILTIPTILSCSLKFSKSNLIETSWFFLSLTKNMRMTKTIWTIQKALKVFRRLNPRLRNPNPKLRKLMTLRTPLLMMGRTNLSLILTLRFVSFLLHKIPIFWEGHPFLQNFHRTFVLCSNSQIYGGVPKILWPSQNVWSLLYETYTLFMQGIQKTL